LAIIKRSWN